MTYTCLAMNTKQFGKCFNQTGSTCKYCRLKKCLETGMKKEYIGVRRPRVKTGKKNTKTNELDGNHCCPERPATMTEEFKNSEISKTSSTRPKETYKKYSIASTTEEKERKKKLDGQDKSEELKLKQHITILRRYFKTPFKCSNFAPI